MAEPIEVGQRWRRKRDGRVVEIIGFNAEWDDCAWRDTEDPKRKGDIFGTNLRVNYERVDVPDDDPVEVATPYQVLLASLVAEYGGEEEDWTAMRSLYRVLNQVRRAIAAEETPGIHLCSQCGERPSVMVKIGTTDGWCTVCLDEAAGGEQDHG